MATVVVVAGIVVVAAVVVAAIVDGGIVATVVVFATLVVTSNAAVVGAELPPPPHDASTSAPMAKETTRFIVCTHCLRSATSTLAAGQRDTWSAADSSPTTIHIGRPKAEAPPLHPAFGGSGPPMRGASSQTQRRCADEEAESESGRASGEI